MLVDLEILAVWVVFRSATVVVVVERELHPGQNPRNTEFINHLQEIKPDFAWGRLVLSVLLCPERPHGPLLRI